MNSHSLASSHVLSTVSGVVFLATVPGSVAGSGLMERSAPSFGLGGKKKPQTRLDICRESQ